MRPYTRVYYSDTKTKLKTMKISQLNKDVYKSNLEISEWINVIFIGGETYSKMIRQNFNLFS